MIRSAMGLVSPDKSGFLRLHSREKCINPGQHSMIFNGLLTRPYSISYKTAPRHHQSTVLS